MNKTHKVVTVSNRQPTEWYYLQREFFASLKDEVPMLISGQFWGGLTTKPKWLFQALKENRIAEDIIIFPDNWDLVFATGCNEIVDMFLSEKSDVCISAESNCFPSDTKEAYDNLSNLEPYKYLNSGFIIGYKEAIYECLKSMDIENVPNDYWDSEKECAVHPNDQLLWQQEYLKQPVNIKLDCNQWFSQTLHDADIKDFDFSGERIVNKITNTAPCTFHFNGGAKSNLSLREPILKHLNLI